MFANTIVRTNKNNQEWSWVYGNDKLGHEKKDIIPSYEKYLKNGQKGEIHPMYFFLSFIDGNIPNLISEMETYYRENNISYSGWDYVAYFMAKNYNINVIPYIEASGNSISNSQVVKDVIENSNSSYIYLGDNDIFNEYKNISLPPTINVLYDGNERTITGMSNPNSTIFIKINDKEFTTTTDNNGKFSFDISNDITVNTNIEVASKEQNKEKSFYKKVSVKSSLNEIIFKGYKDNEFLKLSLDKENKKFKAVSNGESANPYHNSSEYIKIQHYSKKGDLKGKYKLRASQNADSLAGTLNNISYIDGDYLKLTHQEQQNRLSITGYVKNAPYLLESNVGNLDLDNSYFYIQNNAIVYSDKMLDLSANKDDLIEKIKEAKEIESEGYTKASYNNLQ